MTAIHLTGQHLESLESEGVDSLGECTVPIQEPNEKKWISLSGTQTLENIAAEGP